MKKCPICGNNVAQQSYVSLVREGIPQHLIQFIENGEALYYKCLIRDSHSHFHHFLVFPSYEVYFWDVSDFVAVKWRKIETKEVVVFT